MKKSKSNYVYAQSKFNRHLVEHFEIEESIIGFDHGDFRQRIKDELAYLGLDTFELASKCYISHSRMQYLMYQNVHFSPGEIASIKKILGM